MKKPGYEIGMISAGVMSRKLLFNTVNRGIAEAGYDKEWSQAAALRSEVAGRDRTAPSVC